MPIKNIPTFNSNQTFTQQREEKAQKQFKAVLRDMVHLLRNSTDSDTVSLHWVNKNRGIFVLETVSTRCKNTMFQDRVVFENHFLGEYTDLKEAALLEVGKHLPAEQLKHYYNSVPIRFLLLIPFVNNGETVAITVLESKFQTITEEEEDAIEAYMNALGNLLHTYLELADLSDDQSQWSAYEDLLDTLDDAKTPEKLIEQAANEVQKWLKKGGVSVVMRSTGEWLNSFNAERAYKPLPLGMKTEQHSIVNEALVTGNPVFNIHFNGNPKRIAAHETVHNGATYAVPLKIRDRRQAVLLAYDENPLVMTEAVKHKISNVVRLTALLTERSRGKISPDEDLFTTKLQLIEGNVWRMILSNEIHRQKHYHDKKTWFGLVAIDNVQTMRSKYRLEEMLRLQQEVIERIKPCSLKMNGILGLFSDYVYGFMLQSEDDEYVSKWVKQINHRMKEPINVRGNDFIDVNLRFGYTAVKEESINEEQIVSEAKTALSHAVKNRDVLIFEY